VGQHSSASGSALLGLDGFQLVSAELLDGEWQLEVQTLATMVGCGGCGVPATPHGRRTVQVRDLPIGRWCSCGASASGAVGIRPAESGPGPSERLRSGRGRC
jgi:hypothetical protein